MTKNVPAKMKKLETNKL